MRSSSLVYDPRNSGQCRKAVPLEIDLAKRICLHYIVPRKVDLGWFDLGPKTSDKRSERIDPIKNAALRLTIPLQSQIASAV